MSRIFLAGASGVIGRRLVPMLRGQGHHVTGTTRSAERARSLRRLGADVVLVDVYDQAALSAALGAAAPAVVIHQLTDLPPNPDPARAAQYVADNARLRSVGTAHLVRAAIEAGARRLIAQSIGWAYAPADHPSREEDALDTSASGTRAVTVSGVAALEASVLGTGTLTGVVLRYGALYGPGTGALTPRYGLPVVHVDAAAHAAMLAIADPVHGIFNIAEPGPQLSIERARSVLGWQPDYRLPAEFAQTP